jgi:hypothetical protein
MTLISERYFKGVQPHLNIERIEAEVAFGNLASNEHAYTTVKHEPLAHSSKQKADEAIKHTIEVAISALKSVKG